MQSPYEMAEPSSLERMRAGHVSSQCGRAGPPALLSSVVRRTEEASSVAPTVRELS